MDPCELFFDLHVQLKKKKRGSLPNLPANSEDTKDTGSIPGSGRSPGVGNGNPLQYSCLENPTNRGARLSMVQGATESWT